MQFSEQRKMKTLHIMKRESNVDRLKYEINGWREKILILPPTRVC